MNSKNQAQSPIFRRLLTATLLFLGISMSARAELTVGDPAPALRLQDQNGAWHTLDQYRGSWVTLYFYPKDDTPGCTKEACAFRDNIFAFEEIGAIVLGISLDNVESHAAFAEKYHLPFPLLADTDGEVAKTYGVLKTMGTFRFAQRQSFIIDPDGKIAKHYQKVDAEKHSADVLADLKGLIETPPS